MTCGGRRCPRAYAAAARAVAILAVFSGEIELVASEPQNGFPVSLTRLAADDNGAPLFRSEDWQPLSSESPWLGFSAADGGGPSAPLRSEERPRRDRGAVAWLRREEGAALLEASGASDANPIEVDIAESFADQKKDGPEHEPTPSEPLVVGTDDGITQCVHYETNVTEDMGGKIHVLEQHRPSCKPNWILREWMFIRPGVIDRMTMKFTCCPVTYLRETCQAVTSDKVKISASNNDLRAIYNLPSSCPESSWKGYHELWGLSSFSFWIFPLGETTSGELALTSVCCPLVSAGACKHMQTKWSTNRHGRFQHHLAFLETLDVKCAVGYALTGFKLENSGSKIRITYRCCIYNSAPDTNAVLGARPSTLPPTTTSTTTTSSTTTSTTTSSTTWTKTTTDTTTTVTTTRTSTTSSTTTRTTTSSTNTTSTTLISTTTSTTTETTSTTTNTTTTSSTDTRPTTSTTTNSTTVTTTMTMRTQTTRTSTSLPAKSKPANFEDFVSTTATRLFSTSTTTSAFGAVQSKLPPSKATPVPSNAGAANASAANASVANASAANASAANASAGAPASFLLQSRQAWAAYPPKQPPQRRVASGAGDALFAAPVTRAGGGRAGQRPGGGRRK